MPGHSSGVRGWSFVTINISSRLPLRFSHAPSSRSDLATLVPRGRIHVPHARRIRRVQQPLRTARARAQIQHRYLLVGLAQTTTRQRLRRLRLRLRRLRILAQRRRLPSSPPTAATPACRNPRLDTCSLGHALDLPLKSPRRSPAPGRSAGSHARRTLGVRISHPHAALKSTWDSRATAWHAPDRKTPRGRNARSNNPRTRRDAGSAPTPRSAPISLLPSECSGCSWGCHCCLSSVFLADQPVE